MELVAALLIAGVVLLILETVLPGMIAGIVGFICIAAGVVAAYARLPLAAANSLLASVVVVLIAGFALWIRYFPNSSFARPFISKRNIGDVGADRPQLLHKTGTAFTLLRPSGTAIINGERVDVVSEGPFISPGTPIEVVKIEGMRIVVRPL